MREFVTRKSETRIYACLRKLFIGTGHLNSRCQGHCERSIRIMFSVSFLEFGVVKSVHPVEKNMMPPAPSKPEVTNISQTSVTLSWKSSPNNDKLPTSYLIEAFR